MRDLRTRAARCVAALLAFLLAAPAAWSAVSLSVEQPRGTPDVELRWESDGPGPFTLLRLNSPPGSVPASSLPLDPALHAFQAGVASPLLLAGEADFGTGAGQRVYQVLDEGTGELSNAGYVIGIGIDDPDAAFYLSLPGRHAYPDARSFVEQHDQVGGVARWDSDACRFVALTQQVSGLLDGVNFPILPWEPLYVSFLEAGPVALVGAAEPAGQPITLETFAWQCVRAHGLPYGNPGGAELACGIGGWEDVDSDFRFESCSSGAWSSQQLTEPEPFLTVRIWYPFGFGQSLNVELDDEARTIVFNEFPMPAGHAVRFMTSRGYQDRTFTAPDAGLGDPGPDADSDGALDAAERLLGTDPGDALSLPADRDGDGVRDVVDNCVASPNAAQLDTDGDEAGDACDPCPTEPLDDCDDADGDGVGRAHDTCPDVTDVLQSDFDGDGFGDACDICPRDYDLFQYNADGDCLGDACDPEPDVASRLVFEGLRVQKGTRSGSDYLVGWALGNVYGAFEVVVGDIAHLHEDRGFARAECLVSSLDAQGVRDAAAGSRWYLVRLDHCPLASFGDARTAGDDPRDELDAASPCP